MTRRLAVLLATLVPLACRSQPPQYLRDTEGRRVEARCGKDGGCVLEQRSGPRWPGAGRELGVAGLGHLVALCDVPLGTLRPRAAEDCRPLECEKDPDCPPGPGALPGQCLSGACVDPMRELTADDAVALCLAGTGLGCETPTQLERRALGLNCGSPCRIPKPCRALAHLGP